VLLQCVFSCLVSCVVSILSLQCSVVCVVKLNCVSMKDYAKKLYRAWLKRCILGFLCLAFISLKNVLFMLIVVISLKNIEI